MQVSSTEINNKFLQLIYYPKQTIYAISQAAYSQVQQETPQSDAGSSDSSSSESPNSDDDVIDAEYTKE